MHTWYSYAYPLRDSASVLLESHYRLRYLNVDWLNRQLDVKGCLESVGQLGNVAHIGVPLSVQIGTVWKTSLLHKTGAGVLTKRVYTVRHGGTVAAI